MSSTGHPKPLSDHCCLEKQRTRRQSYCGHAQNASRHPDLFWFGPRSTDRVLTSGLMRKFYRLILRVPRIQRCSNTESIRNSSALNGHSLESYSASNFTANTYIGHFIEKQMLCRSQRCLELLNTNHVSYILDYNSSDIRPPCGIQLPK